MVTEKHSRFYLSPAHLLALLVVSALSADGSATGQSHPFLIVREEMYAELQARSDQEPWATWKNAAMNYDRTYDVTRSYRSKAGDMSKIVSRASLAYILDEQKRSLYVQRIVNAITTGWPDLSSGLNRSDWGTVVPPGNALFDSVLAADVIYNAMSSTERQRVEDVLRQAANFYIESQTSWRLNLYGNRLAWGLYTGDRTLADKAKADYLNELSSQLSDDGVFVAGPGYASNRLGGLRSAKTHTMDVLEFTGEAQLYDDPRVIDFYEWLYGYSVTPFRRRYSFGDSAPNRNGLQNGPRAVSAHRFSEAAASYAAWSLNGEFPSASLLAYVLMDQPLADPKLPPSRVFSDGGAYFREAINSPDALAGALNNVTTDGGHTHKEANGVHLAAYGEHILRNAGYKGWGTGAYGFTWEYVNRTARSANVVSVEGNDHLVKVGAGVAESFTGHGFDYASGNSGQALLGGRHWRNFCLVHSADEANGYFIVFDEVYPAVGTRSADLYLHPNSDETDITTEGLAYTWEIGAFHTHEFDTDTSNNNLEIRESENGVHVTAFLASSPQTATIERGLLAQWDETFVGEYLHATYPVDGHTGFLTLILPHDNSHLPPTPLRISGPYHSGARVDHGAGIVDYAAESTSDSTYRIGETEVRGLATWFRTRNDTTVSVFLRKGVGFESPMLGFTAEDEVSLLLEGQAGQVISPGTHLTIRSNRALDLVLNGGTPLSVVSSGVDWIQVYIPEGRHSFSLVTLAPPALSVPPNLDLGEVPKDRVSRGSLVLTNTGEGPMIVSDVRSDFSGFSSDALPVRIEAGEAREVAVSVRGGTGGASEGVVEIYTNSPDHPVTFVKLTGLFTTVAADARADFDGDGVVGFSDFLAFVQAFGSSDAAYDIDRSGSVDFGDFLILADSFGRSVMG